MKRNLVVAVFASLQGLEKCVEGSKRMFLELDCKPYHIAEALEEQGRVLKQMRHTAIRLQLQLAKNDWTSSVRSLQIFYGLRQMVRPEIMASFRGLANEELAMPSIESTATVH